VYGGDLDKSSTYAAVPFVPFTTVITLTCAVAPFAPPNNFVLSPTNVGWSP
jgi:hypothetical protein